MNIILYIKYGRKPLSHDTIVVSLLMTVTLLMPSLSSAAARKGLTKSAQGCTVPAVREHEHTTLTCYFGKDVRLDKMSVKILHFGSNSNETVLVCFWHFGTLDCITKSGYAFDGIITDELRLQIPDVTQDRAGTYACIVSGTESEELHSCIFALEGKGGFREAITHHLFPILIIVTGLLAIFIFGSIAQIIYVQTLNALAKENYQEERGSRLHTNISRQIAIVFSEGLQNK